MLALTRKIGQSIVIGDQIEITVVEVKGDQIRIAISAPKNISIYRKEIYDEIKAENKAAANITEVPMETVDKTLFEAIKLNPKK